MDEMAAYDIIPIIVCIQSLTWRMNDMPADAPRHGERKNNNFAQKFRAEGRTQ